jgi:solute carrier family 8 (sodium/calcium exchanger)
MASIEFITSKKKEVQVKDEFGRPKTIVVHIWNETVANMTLMAMGCSAPEILLGIIEVVGKGFEADELGPGVAVGSAAINLFLVVGICNLSLPRGEVRRIKRVSVFLVNAIWSLFSFCWLFIILKWSSPGVVETWEGVVTFLFFPLTVISAYLVDIKGPSTKTLSKTYGIGRHGVIVETTGDEVKLVKTDFSFKHSDGKNTDEIPDLEDHRQSFIKAMKSVRITHPVSHPRDLELLAEKKVLEETTIHQAVHEPLSLLICGPSMERSSKPIFELGAPSSANGFHKSPSSSSMNENVTKVLFRPGHLTVLKKSGELNATVVREGGDLKRRLLVDYTTEDSEALADRDYVPLLGTLAFEPDETSKTIEIQIKNDEVYRGDLLFCIRLFNIRIDEEADYPEEVRSADQLHFKIDFRRLFPPTIIESPRNSVVSETETETYIPGSSRIPAITVTNVELPPIPSPITKYYNQAVALGSPSIATVLILDNGHQVISIKFTFLL